MAFMKFGVHNLLESFTPTSQCGLGQRGPRAAAASSDLALRNLDRRHPLADGSFMLPAMSSSSVIRPVPLARP